MRRSWVGMASFVAVLLVLAFGHRWSATATWFTSDKTCAERHATPWFVERLNMDCDRLLFGWLFGLFFDRCWSRRGQSFKQVHCPPPLAGRSLRDPAAR